MQTLDIDPQIKTALTIPSTFYTSPHWYEMAKDKIFAKTWQFCLNADELKQAGQIVPLTLLPGLLNEPIMFVRDPDNVLRCLSNVCTHRGSLLVTSSCVAQKIKCPYHGRRFTLCGDFMHMPAFEQAENFPSESDNLSNIPFNQLGKFLFASINPSATFQAVFSDIIKRLSWLPLNEMYFDTNRARDYQINAHWALYVENYLEGLHIPFVHPALRNVLDFGNYTYELGRYANLQLAIASEGEECFDLPTDSPDYGKRIAAYYYWIFPNTMLNFYPWGCSVNVVKPAGPALTNISFLPFVLDESKLGRGAGGDLDTVEREDEAIVELVQQGIQSRCYTRGRYSPTMEKCTHHFHQLICEFLGA